MAVVDDYATYVLVIIIILLLRVFTSVLADSLHMWQQVSSKLRSSSQSSNGSRQEYDPNSLNTSSDLQLSQFLGSFVLFQGLLLWLVSQSDLCSIVFQQGFSTYPGCSLLISLGGLLDWRSSLIDKFFSYYQLELGLIIWPRLRGQVLSKKKSNRECYLVFPVRSWFVHVPLVCMVKLQSFAQFSVDHLCCECCCPSLPLCCICLLYC